MGSLQKLKKYAKICCLNERLYMKLLEAKKVNNVQEVKRSGKIIKHHIKNLDLAQRQTRRQNYSWCR